MDNKRNGRGFKSRSSGEVRFMAQAEFICTGDLCLYRSWRETIYSLIKQKDCTFAL